VQDPKVMSKGREGEASQEKAGVNWKIWQSRTNGNYCTWERAVIRRL